MGPSRDGQNQGVKARVVRDGYALAQRQLAAGDLAGAAASFERVLVLLQEVNDLLGQARVLVHLAQLREIHKAPAEAERYYRQALDLACQLSDLRLEALIGQQLGALIRARQPDQARVLFQRTADVCFVLRDLEGRALAQAMIGQIDFTAGDQEGGMHRLLQALLELPSDGPARKLVTEYVAAAGQRMDSQTYRMLIDKQIQDRRLRRQLLAGGKSSPADHEPQRERR